MCANWKLENATYVANQNGGHVVKKLDRFASMIQPDAVTYEQYLLPERETVGS
jgi:hypothetical protein